MESTENLLKQNFNDPTFARDLQRSTKYMGQLMKAKDIVESKIRSETGVSYRNSMDRIKKAYPRFYELVTDNLENIKDTSVDSVDKSTFFYKGRKRKEGILMRARSEIGSVSVSATRLEQDLLKETPEIKNAILRISNSGASDYNGKEQH